jgi:dCTP diphosphatase
MPFTPRCLDSIRAEAAEFANERDWEQFHSPRNLLLAVVSEVGELAEVVRWSGDREPAITEANRQAWEDEMADVFILLVRLADRSGVDLTTAFARKLQKAREKYPVDEYKGSSRKAGR